MTRVTDVHVDQPSQVVSLIPSTFLLVPLTRPSPSVAGLARWMSPPALVVLSRELQYAGHEDAMLVLDREVEAKTLQRLVQDLVDGYTTMTDGRLGELRLISVESPTPGTRVQLYREGTVVVARARDLASLARLGGSASPRGRDGSSTVPEFCLTPTATISAPAVTEPHEEA